jgi:hypothetical protein
MDTLYLGIALQELGTVLCLVYPKSDKCLYHLRRMGVELTLVNHRLRQTCFTPEQKCMIKKLLNQVLLAETDDHNIIYHRVRLYNAILYILTA